MILAVSGSLRRSSLNIAVLRAAALAGARDGVFVDIDDSARQLPHFDPDLEGAPPDVVRGFRARCKRAAGLLFAVPEYAYGIPGSFKNAPDWTVGSGSLYRKSVAVLDVAPPGRGAHAREALDRVLRALDADVTHYSVPIAPSEREANAEISHAKTLADLQAVVSALAQRADSGRAV
jgi:NAD(P)H-dependent FMN reductase